MKCPRCKTLIKGRLTHCHHCGVKFSFCSLIDDQGMSPNSQDEWRCKLCRKSTPGTHHRFSHTVDEGLATFILKSDHDTILGRTIALRSITNRPPIIIAPICHECFRWIDQREKRCHDVKRDKQTIQFAEKARAREEESAYEEATTYFEMAGLWKDAARSRKKGGRMITKSPDFDLDDLINDMRRCVIAMPYKCQACGAKWMLAPSKTMDCKNRCEKCGALLDKSQIRQFLTRM